MRPDLVFDVITAPHISEKSAVLTEKNNQVVFKVAPNATKYAIKKAVESLFDVKVDKVTTLNVKGKSKRFGKTFGRRSDWKKAYITLAADSKLDFAEIKAD